MARKPGHILVVDDNRLNRCKLTIGLDQQGHTTAVAENGREALRMIEEQKFDLMLLDILMPEMDGYQVLEHLSERGILQEMPVLVISAVENLSSVVRCIEIGADDYLTKPFDAVLLRARIDACLERKRLHDELREASFCDYLTGLWNRRYLSRSITRDIARLNRAYEDDGLTATLGPAAGDILAFLILDLDHFRVVNSDFGHEGGDRVLREFADILRNVCRESDIKVRWGGEEFLIVCDFSSVSHAPILAERLRQAVAEHEFRFQNGQTARITCSIGFAVYPFLSTDHKRIPWDEVVNVADKALYAAKKSGRNAWVGILSTDQTSSDNLYRGIREDIETLIEADELKIQTSIPEPGTLIWS